MSSFSDIMNQIRDSAARGQQDNKSFARATRVARLEIPNASTTGTAKTATTTVPAGETWRILSAGGTFTTNSTAGNRSLNILVTSSSGIRVWDGWIGDSVAASQTNAVQLFSTSLGQDRSYVPHSYRVMPVVIANAGDTITFNVGSGVAAADVATYFVHYEVSTL